MKKTKLKGGKKKKKKCFFFFFLEIKSLDWFDSDNTWLFFVRKWYFLPVESTYFEKHGIYEYNEKFQAQNERRLVEVLISVYFAWF